MDIKIESQRAKIAQLQTVIDAVKAMPEPNLTKPYLQTQIKIITDLWDVVDNNHTLIFEAFIEADRVKETYFIEDVYKGIFDKYVKALTRIQTKLDKLKPPSTSNPEFKLPEGIVISASKDKSNVKLKPIEIPTFSGDLKKWISFRSMFDSLIHNSKELSGLQKIHYLKSCLEGEAERMLSQYNITENDYEGAYKALTDRYHNERKLVDTHITTLISQPSLQHESSKGIKELLDVTNENLHALNKLNIDTTTWDPILLLLLVPKLDPATKRLWELTLKPKVTPSRKEFLDFLETRFYALGCEQEFKISVEATSASAHNQNNRKSFSMGQRYDNASNFKPNFQNQDYPPRIHQNYHNSFQRPCPICPEDIHSIFTCEKFRNASPRMRIEMATCAKLCKRCLRNHKSACNQQLGCRYCCGNHHTFLHLDRQEDRNELLPVNDQQAISEPSPVVINSNHVSLQRSAQNPDSTSATVTKSHHVKTQAKETSGNNGVDRYVTSWDAPVLLATAIILVRSEKDNNFYPFRCLLDQASEASHISQRAAQILGLNKKTISASMSGLGGAATVSADSVVNFEVGSKVNQSFVINVQAVVVPKVTNKLPSTYVYKKDWKHIEGLRLADPEFYKPADIDFILGAPVYGYSLLPGLIKSTQDSPVAQNTEFGWILSGPTGTAAKPIKSFHLKIEPKRFQCREKKENWRNSHPKSIEHGTDRFGNKGSTVSDQNRRDCGVWNRNRYEEGAWRHQNVFQFNHRNNTGEIFRRDICNMTTGEGNWREAKHRNINNDNSQVSRVPQSIRILR